MRLVVSIARRYRSRAPLCGLDFEDLCQEGVLGLNRGIERFDPSRGFTLSTFATWWVRQAITRRLEHGGLLKKPAHLAHVQARLSRLPPGLSDEEAAAAIGATEAQVRNARLPSLQRVASLSAPLRAMAGDDEANTLADVLAAPADPDQLLSLDLEAAVERLREEAPDALALIELQLVDRATLKDLAPLLGAKSRQGAQLKLAAVKARLRALVPEAEALLQSAA